MLVWMDIITPHTLYNYTIHTRLVREGTYPGISISESSLLPTFFYRKFLLKQWKILRFEQSFFFLENNSDIAPENSSEVCDPYFIFNVLLLYN